MGLPGLPGAPGPVGPAGKDGESAELLLSGRSCPAGSFVSGFDSRGGLVCTKIAEEPAGCPTTEFVASMRSVSNGAFIPAFQWPGGVITVGTEQCNVKVDRPGGQIDVVGALGDPWKVAGSTGFGSCFIAKVNTPSCGSIAAIGSVTANRPSCSSALATLGNSPSTATVNITCVP
jgi:hypothetical protein